MREYIEKLGPFIVSKDSSTQTENGGFPKIMMMENRENIPEDAHQCYYCTDFAYNSLIKCTFHKIHYCLYHQFMCGCSQEKLEIVYRYSTKELEKILKGVEDSCRINNHNNSNYIPEKNQNMSDSKESRESTEEQKVAD